MRTLEARIWTIWGESGSETVDLLYASGIDAMRERRLTDARDIFGGIIALDPAFAEGWNKCATVHFLLLDYGQSIADVAQTLALEPRHFGALSRPMAAPPRVVLDPSLPSGGGRCGRRAERWWRRGFRTAPRR